MWHDGRAVPDAGNVRKHVGAAGAHISNIGGFLSNVFHKDLYGA
jgi:hypothetical protein